MKKGMKKGCIYILTNPSFPEYVKIGYADDVDLRLKQLNRSECTPFAFRLYAYYEVDTKLTDLSLHRIIEKINPELRSIDNVNGKQRKREFFCMTPDTAYELFEAIAEINDMSSRLHKVKLTEEDTFQETLSNENRDRVQLPRLSWMLEQEILKVGDEIYVTNHPEEIAVINDGYTVKYNDEIMSLNKFGCLVTGWSSIQSYSQMRVKSSNIKLSELRRKRMLEINL